MHKSQLAGLILDCETQDVAAAADFWGAALGARPKHETRPEGGTYVELDVRPGQPYAEVQAVTHESRVHLDIETDDIAAEVRRLEKLGARKIDAVKTWVVMEAPTGQRFCVVGVNSPTFAESANVWGDETGQ